MSTILLKLVESLTAEEQAEVESFALYVLARRNLKNLNVLTDDVSTQELMSLVAHAGSFDWLENSEEDIYSLNDGEPVQWPHDKSDEEV
jgi:hypothetical protein